METVKPSIRIDSMLMCIYGMFVYVLFFSFFLFFIFEKHKIPSNKYRRKVDNTNLLTLTIDRAKNKDRQSDFQVIPLHSTEQKN